LGNLFPAINGGAINSLNNFCEEFLNYLSDEWLGHFQIELMLYKDNSFRLKPAVFGQFNPRHKWRGY
jgi:regulator of sigma D